MGISGGSRPAWVNGVVIWARVVQEISPSLLSAAFLSGLVMGYWSRPSSPACFWSGEMDGAIKGPSCRPGVLVLGGSMALLISLLLVWAAGRKDSLWCWASSLVRVSCGGRRWTHCGLACCGFDGAGFKAYRGSMATGVDISRSLCPSGFKPSGVRLSWWLCSRG